MSGFLPDIASWALGGGAGNSNSANNSNDVTVAPSAAPLSDGDMRARRMARLAALDTPAEQPKMDTDIIMETKITSSSPGEAEPVTKKQAKAMPRLDTASSARQKLRRSKAMLLRRVLLVSIGDDDSAHNCVRLTLDDTDWNDNEAGFGVRHVAEILANRLSLDSTSEYWDLASKQTTLIAYLAGCYRRAGEDWKERKKGTLDGRKKDTAGADDDLCDILEEIRKQVVSYAASSLLIPDLFQLGLDSSLQLAKCLTTTVTDPASSITFDVFGKNTSFYYSLCEELYSQDVDAFEKVIADVVNGIINSLSKCNTLLDEGSSEGAGVVGGNGLLLTSALRELCTHKKAALTFTKMPSFLLPSPDTAQAEERIIPPIPQPPAGSTPQQVQLFLMMQSMTRTSRSGYLRRSGPGLEKGTILGLVLRLGVSDSHPLVAGSFTKAASRTKKDVNQSIEGFRRQLELYQNKCHELVKQLLISGEEVRRKVIQWFTDALLVNVNAGGTRPDRTKVSSTEFLLNLSVIFLKLCEPIVNDPKKALLVDPGFVSSHEHHGGVYDLTGSDHLSRLGENVTDTGVKYAPDNSFIPFCFFFCSRSLALSIVPEASAFENINYHARRTAWNIQQQHGDIRSDPRLDQILGIQYAKEIYMQSHAYITDIVRFYGMAAGVMLRIDKEQLKAMPEHIVADCCAVLDFAAEFAPSILSGIDFGNIFRFTVKLLSKDYSHLVRNYNLRAKLGDVLHDIFLPSGGDDRRDVPSSISCDPLTGGQPYLTSDQLAQDCLAPSLLLLYGEVEHTGYYEKNSHRTKIAKLLKFLWESPEHKLAFKRITEDKTSFRKFANGIVNEMNDQFANVMERLPAIRVVQLQMANPQEWAALSEEERETISSRHEENEQQVKRVLPLCNSVMKMLGFLNTDKDIRDMFLLPEMCSRLANMLLHVLTKLVGSRGLDLKVDNPESYNFRPKEMLQDLCVVFSSFAAAEEFQMECAKSGYYTPDLMNKSVRTCRKLGLLVGESMELLALLESKIADASRMMACDEDLYDDAPEEFLDPLLSEFMTDPVLLPTSGKVVDRKTITQHLLNDSMDPFNRKELCVEDIVPAVDLKMKIDAWLSAKKEARSRSS